LEETPRERTASRLIQAGLYRRNSIASYMLVKFFLVLVPPAIGLLAGLLGWVNLLHGLLAGIVLGLVGTILPSFWLDARKRSRQTQMRRALPDALDVIVTCVEAGLSLPAAIARVGRELQGAHPALAAEMTIVEREIQLGCSSGEAIKRFAQRYDLAELRSLASVILQAEKFGSSVTQALRVHAEELRRKRFQAAEEQAQKASVKLLLPTILFIFPALYVVLLGPAVFDIVKFMQELQAR
jgi:tight adherence protein C